MHARCNAEVRGSIFGQPMPFECMGICVLSPAHEYEMRGSLVYLLIVKYLSMLFKISHSILDWDGITVDFSRIFSNIFRGVCRPYHLQG